jgi:hypothetical protein
LAPHLVVGEQRPQEALLLLFGAVHDDGRCPHAVADASPHSGHAASVMRRLITSCSFGDRPEAAVPHGKWNERQALSNCAP